MNTHESLALARTWQAAANDQALDRLLALSDPNIELLGPRGGGSGHQLLHDWLARAGLSLTTLRTFARHNVVVMAQRGVWRSPETGEALGEATVASLFRSADQRVTQLARYDDLDTALAAANLTLADEITSEQTTGA